MSQPDDERQLDAIFDAIRRLALSGDIPTALARRSLSSDTTIEELGLDSLGRLLLIEEISGASAKYVRDDVFDGLETLGDLRSALRSYSAATG